MNPRSSVKPLKMFSFQLHVFFFLFFGGGGGGGFFFIIILGNATWNGHLLMKTKKNPEVTFCVNKQKIQN